MTSGSDKLVLIPVSPNVHDDKIQWVLGIVGFRSNVVSMKWGQRGDSEAMPVVGQGECFSWICVKVVSMKQGHSGGVESRPVVDG